MCLLTQLKHVARDWQRLQQVFLQSIKLLTTGELLSVIKHNSFKATKQLIQFDNSLQISPQTLSKIAEKIGIRLLLLACLGNQVGSYIQSMFRLMAIHRTDSCLKQR
ncbi:hypothetical protein XM47_08160 [Catenovulum maritimum]|uniref:Uncharacterized protein n=1 Tax=Catenovulum maritimum TaxID=1513271 RepID=A0A0J8GWI6_9ALTE|nr:hypothetical protein XM47_08160 [Catenovulum maritimum]